MKGLDTPIQDGICSEFPLTSLNITRMSCFHHVHLPLLNVLQIINYSSVWDEAIIQRCMRLYHNSSQFLLQTSIEKELLTPSNIKKWRSCTSEKTIDKPRDCAEKWAKESFKDALMYAYKDENGNEIVDGDVLTDAYFSSRLGIVRQRLAAAGVRLAAALEGVFQEQQSEMVQLE